VNWKGEVFVIKRNHGDMSRWWRKTKLLGSSRHSQNKLVSALDGAQTCVGKLQWCVWVERDQQNPAPLWTGACMVWVHQAVSERRSSDDWCQSRCGWGSVLCSDHFNTTVASRSRNTCSSCFVPHAVPCRSWCLSRTASVGSFALVIGPISSTVYLLQQLCFLWT